MKLKELQHKKQVQLLKEDVDLLKWIKDILLELSILSENIIKTQEEEIKTYKITTLLLTITLWLTIIGYSLIL